MEIHLQEIGMRNAIYAKDLKAGQVMICNFGYTQTITSVDKRTEKSIMVTILCDGKLYPTTFRNTRLVAVQNG